MNIFSLLDSGSCKVMVCLLEDFFVVSLGRSYHLLFWILIDHCFMVYFLLIFFFHCLYELIYFIPFLSSLFVIIVR